MKRTSAQPIFYKVAGVFMVTAIAGSLFFGPIAGNDANQQALPLSAAAFAQQHHMQKAESFATLQQLIDKSGTVLDLAGRVFVQGESEPPIRIAQSLRLSGGTLCGGMEIVPEKRLAISNVTFTDMRLLRSPFQPDVPVISIPPMNSLSLNLRIVSSHIDSRLEGADSTSRYVAIHGAHPVFGTIDTAFYDSVFLAGEDTEAIVRMESYHLSSFNNTFIGGRIAYQVSAAQGAIGGNNHSGLTPFLRVWGGSLYPMMEFHGLEEIAANSHLILDAVTRHYGNVERPPPEGNRITYSDIFIGQEIAVDMGSYRGEFSLVNNLFALRSPFPLRVRDARAELLPRFTMISYLSPQLIRNIFAPGAAILAEAGAGFSFPSFGNRFLPMPLLAGEAPPASEQAYPGYETIAVPGAERQPPPPSPGYNIG